MEPVWPTPPDPTGNPFPSNPPQPADEPKGDDGPLSVWERIPPGSVEPQVE